MSTLLNWSHPMSNAKVLPAAVLASACLLLANLCHAGRPLAVDDANVNDAGAGHVEVFYQRLAGPVHTTTVSPAYGVREGLEIAGLFNRDNTSDTNTSAIQAKVRLTAPQTQGCNLAASFGLSQPNVPGAGFSKFANGLATCNRMGVGSLHVNLGLINLPTGINTGVWGLAFEREFGPATGHIEVLGAENQLPTLQLGVRTLLTRSVQLDATLGSQQGETLYSFGLKFLF